MDKNEKELYEAIDIISFYVKENGFALHKTTFGKWRDVMEDIENHLLEKSNKKRKIKEAAEAYKKLENL